VGDDNLETRAATVADRPAVIDLCRRALGWAEGDPNEAFFAWKHEENAFGRSPSWVSVTPDGRIVGVRVFMRWRFRSPSEGTLEAVRAVDTATDPDWQGRGIFTTLTLGALPDLRAGGVDFVFNTPNEKSRPGYLKMGWSQVGRLPVSVRAAGLAAVGRLGGARTAADRWSVDVPVGIPAREAFRDDDEVAAMLSVLPTPDGLATDRSPGYLRWRYSFGPLHYRAVPLGDRIRDGVVVLRFRRRGAALEGTVCEVLNGAGRAVPWSSVVRDSGCDYLIRTGSGPVGQRFLPAPRIGPVLTWKPLCRTGVPSMRGLDLSLGDVELF
jgi:GNAT superfamily N-acetyltransferase